MVWPFLPLPRNQFDLNAVSHLKVRRGRGEADDHHPQHTEAQGLRPRSTSAPASVTSGLGNRRRSGTNAIKNLLA